jgi:hypothetical protein
MYVKSERIPDQLEFTIEQEDWDNHDAKGFIKELKEKIPHITGRFYDSTSKIWTIYRDYWEIFYKLKAKYFGDE